MSKWEKLLRRILNLSNDIRFEELRKVLEEYVYAMHAPKSGSSHCSFRKKGYPTITVPRHDPVKPHTTEVACFPSVRKRT